MCRRSLQSGHSNTGLVCDVLVYSPRVRDVRGQGQQLRQRGGRGAVHGQVVATVRHVTLTWLSECPRRCPASINDSRLVNMAELGMGQAEAVPTSHSDAKFR